ncbi:DUF4124 domain-containing protein [Luteibacter sahnii]|uniref:DUF4124 domain-containing protein n=1 Tax=Luteibacter sahnii TaxID=3021977 RepID=UPI002A698E21|nr:DUF4124 domain-containing protein [Luteibacter sp. PPL193]MDY1549597.1 DUF4124 domain-containing protein [Luteibacter sp. PPL193]
MRRPYRLVLIAAIAVADGVAGVSAATVYKCLANGQTVYQQSPCARGQRQAVIHLDDPAPAASTPAPRTAAVDAPERLSDPAPARPMPPLPRLFGCVRATDGKPYLSDNGDPALYLAPLGVLGAVSGPLAADVPAGSAPELNRHTDYASATQGNYVWVQDRCRRLSGAETCAALRDEAEANQRAIRNAFKSQRAPLDAKDAQLRDQLRACP